MELLVLASRYFKQPERERIVMQAVLEAAEDAGAKRVVKRRGNVYSTDVYMVNGKEKSLLYNDWDKYWDRKKVYRNMMATIQLYPRSRNKQQIRLTA